MDISSGPFFYLFRDSIHPAEWNMRADEAIFRYALHYQIQTPILRFYRFDRPSYSVGYGAWKQAASFLQGDAPAVRRLTGGGIVRHDGDLTYSLVLPVDIHSDLKRAKTSYAFIHNELLKVLGLFGIEASLQKENRGNGQFCFDSPVEYDVMLENRKLAGGAQKRSMGYLLHQGTMDWNFLLQRKPGLKEKEFSLKAADVFAKTLKLQVKEISLNVETWIRALTYGSVLTQTSSAR